MLFNDVDRKKDRVSDEMMEVGRHNDGAVPALSVPAFSVPVHEVLANWQLIRLSVRWQHVLNVVCYCDV